MAIEIKAIPTLEGKDAERFIERADEAERKFKGEVILEIDPKLTMSLFDMRQGYIHHISRRYA